MVHMVLSSAYRLSREIAELSKVVRKQKEKLEQYGIHRKFMERVLDYSDEVSRSCSFQDMGCMCDSGQILFPCY